MHGYICTHTYYSIVCDDRKLYTKRKISTEGAWAAKLNSYHGILCSLWKQLEFSQLGSFSQGIGWVRKARCIKGSVIHFLKKQCWKIKQQPMCVCYNESVYVYSMSLRKVRKDENVPDGEGWRMVRWVEQTRVEAQLKKRPCSKASPGKQM